MSKTARSKGRCEPFRRGFIDSRITRAGGRFVAASQRLLAILTIFCITTGFAQARNTSYRFQLVTAGGQYPVITAKTDAPNGTKLVVILKKPWLPDGAERVARGIPACGEDCFPASGPDGKSGVTVVVQNGAFEAGPLSFGGKPIAPNVYQLDIYPIFDVNSMTPEEIRTADSRPIYVGQIQIPGTASGESRELSTVQQKLANRLNDRRPNASKEEYIPNWQSIEADNGAVYKVDVNSISRDAEDKVAEVVVYAVEGGEYYPPNLTQLTFDCRGHHFMDLRSFGTWAYAPPRSIAGKIEVIACFGPKRKFD